MASFLNIVASMLSAASLESCNWGSLNRHHIMALTKLLRDTGRSTATVDTYLSTSNGVANAEANVCGKPPAHPGGRNLRSSRLSQGRALPPEENRTLFGACEADDSSTGLRDAVMMCKYPV